MAIKCELCGNTEFVKEDGMFVCKGCNTKYSLDEAKKMMSEEDTKPVATGMSQKLENLYQLARRAKEDDNSENAAKYYEMILIENPTDWEASFYSIYYKAMSCKIAQIASAGNSVNNCTKNVLGLINDNISDEQMKKDAVNEMSLRLLIISSMLYNAAVNHYNGIGDSIRGNYTQEYINNCFAAMNILYDFADLVQNQFGETYAKEICVPCWKNAVEQHKPLIKNLADKEGNKNTILKYVDKIQKYDSSYVTPEIDTSAGCYVATAVYGSYDCPEVWTLRRYRDNTLAESIFGRAFIHTYYAISPTLVKWFGETQWFKNLFKGKLDKMVKSLNEQGFENTPYEDKSWE